LRRWEKYPARVPWCTLKASSEKVSHRILVREKYVLNKAERNLGKFIRILIMSKRVIPSGRRMVQASEDSFAKNRAFLVERLIRVGALRKQSYIDAMQSVKRHLFVWEEFERYAYLDRALPLGKTGQTIPPPHLCAYMLEALGPRVGEKVLEVGSGSGYNAALVAECIAPSNINPEAWGRMTTIERMKALWKFARKNLVRSGYSNRVACVLGDGTLGFPPLHEGELYDKILVTAGAPAPPAPLMMQLKRGGIMVIPIGGKHSQQLTMVIKGESGWVEKLPLQRCEFVPLIGKYGWS
jgi:protein-L-isoaspartate(D-aspartate) O-methyltransferase